MDRLEARRGKGLAIVSPLGEAEGEKVKGVREEIWREKEEEPAGPPFFLSSLPPLPPSLFLSPPSSSAFFFSPRCLSWRKWQVRVEQEVRHVHLVRRNVWLPTEGAHVGIREDVCACALTWRPCTPPVQRFSTSLLLVQAVYQ